MKQNDFTSLYGTTPESFKARVSLALQQLEKPPMKRKITTRTLLIAAALLILFMAVVYAAFSSQVAAFFGRSYGNGMQSWLEKGDVATPNQSFSLDGVLFTLDEVIYRDNGLYGVGSIRPEKDGTVIIPEDHSPSDAYGYDVHGAGGLPETAPSYAPTIADIVREKGGKLLMVRAIPDQIGVDGGAMLSLMTVGYSQVPQRDGSIRCSFEVSDAYAVEEGQLYTIQLWASVWEMTPEGEMAGDSPHGENWTVDISPTPISDAIQRRDSQ